MPVNLTKGQKVDLTKGKPSLKKLMVGLGWDVNRYDGGGDFDLDAAAFMLGAEGKVLSDSDFIFYGNFGNVIVKSMSKLLCKINKSRLVDSSFGTLKNFFFVQKKAKKRSQNRKILLFYVTAEENLSLFVIKDCRLTWGSHLDI